MPTLHPLLRHPVVMLGMYLAAWLFCGWFVWQRCSHATHEFDDLLRADGTSGHVQIDFAGQWTMGRLFVVDGRRLYHRARQRELVREAFPVVDENPAATQHDADALMGWFVGTDPPAGDGIGGPLYPPVHGLLYAPLGQLDSRPAYRLFQWLSAGLAVFAGLAISRAGNGRVWFPLAVVGVFAFPGSRGGLDLGQNNILTLAILAGGWWAMARDRWLLGGAVWGLLAMKPTWAVAFLPVPLLMGQWRAAAAMCGVAAGLIAATLPVVGMPSWFDWLAIGREAAGVYAVNENWISFSRDLAGLPRRLLLDFKVPEAKRDNTQATILGWAVWAVVATGTAIVYRLQRDRRPVGVASGFLLLGAYLTCYRFMYYDATLAVLPLGVLLADRRVRRAWLPITLIALLYAYENWLLHYGLVFTIGSDWKPSIARHAVTGRYNEDPMGQHQLILAGSYRYAWDTAFLLGLWVWAGWRLLTHPAECVEGGPDVGRPHQ